MDGVLSPIIQRLSEPFHREIRTFLSPLVPNYSPLMMILDLNPSSFSSSHTIERHDVLNRHHHRAGE